MSDLVLVVGNPSAQSGRASEYLQRAVDGLARLGWRAELLATQPQGRTIGLVRDAIDERDPRVVVYLGGDGTFNEVGRGILAASKRVPLGMLPMGTANDQGRSLGVRPGPDAIDENLDVIVAGHVTELDVGSVRALDGEQVRAEALFFDSAGWGIAPDILARRNRDRADVEEIPILRAIYRDHAVYAGATIERFISSFIEPTKFDARVVCNGKSVEYEGLTDLIVKATAVYGGQWVLDRYSEPDDGQFELVPIQGRRDWASKSLRDLAVLPLFQEDLDLIGVTHSTGVAGSQFVIDLSRTSVRSQLDGEEWVSAGRFEVQVLANELPVITPRDFRPPWRFERP